MANIDQITNARGTICNAIFDRQMWELEHNSDPRDLASITKYLTTLARNVNDPRKVGSWGVLYFAEHPVAFESVFLSQRRTGACFNVYAMPKALKAGSALHGSALDLADPESETIAAVILAMGRGVTLQKQLANAVDDFMNRPGRGRGSYASGGTQASSALRALEALGIVRNVGGNNWGKGDVERFQRMHDAASGLSLHDVINAELDALITANS